MDKRKEIKKRRNPHKEQNKKKGREETNHTECFKSMLLWGLRIMKSLKDSFELSNGGNAKQNHLSFVKPTLGLFLKRL
jgi:hypothetical protein